MATTLEQQVSGLKLDEKSSPHLKDSPTDLPPPPPPPSATSKDSSKKEEEGGEEEKKENGKEEKDEPAILTNILEDENFQCCMGEQCFLGDPKLKE
ncbi:hypothetical protein SK128_019030, partial [Halocaridina rubra]